MSHLIPGQLLAVLFHVHTEFCISKLPIFNSGLQRARDDDNDSNKTSFIKRYGIRNTKLQLLFDVIDILGNFYLLSNPPARLAVYFRYFEIHPCVRQYLSNNSIRAILL